MNISNIKEKLKEDVAKACEELPVYKKISDIEIRKEEFEDGVVPTKTKLNNLATKEYTINKVDIPKCNYKIEFIPLSKCAGYESLEDRINLCDVVTIKDSRYSIDTQAKVIKVVFDVLRGRYDSMELGEPRTTLGDIIGGTGDGPIQGPQALAMMTAPN